MDIFKTDKLGIIDSDIKIDFINHTVEFTNKLSILRDLLSIKGIILFSFMLLFPIYLSTTEYYLDNQLSFVYITLLWFVLLLFVIFQPYIFHAPWFVNLKEKIHKPKPRFTFEIDNPLHFKFSIYGEFDVTCFGECANHRKTLAFNRKKNILEMFFTEQTEGRIVINEY